MTNYMKSCSFLDASFFEEMQGLRIRFKKAYGEKLIIEKTCVVGTHWNCLNKVPTTYVTENKEENYLERGTFICAHAWIFFKLCIINNSLYTNYDNVFFELDS